MALPHNELRVSILHVVGKEHFSAASCQRDTQQPYQNLGSISNFISMVRATLFVMDGINGFETAAIEAFDMIEIRY